MKGVHTKEWKRQEAGAREDDEINPHSSQQQGAGTSPRAAEVVIYPNSGDTVQTLLPGRPWP